MPLFDSYGRPLTNLRIMVTGRCNFRCFFCHMEGYKRGVEELTLEEIAVIAEAASRLEIRYFKLTGGEPLLRDDIVEIVETIHEHSRKAYISVTTNGSRLKYYASKLAAYVEHVNVSLHSLRPHVFQKITGVNALNDVLEGLEEAYQHGMRIKINMVVLKGLNDNELWDFVKLAEKYNARLQLIELHPVGDGSTVFDKYHLPYVEVLEKLKPRVAKVKVRTGLHARPVLVLDNGVEVEVVGPVGNYMFCSACTRVRITYDGKVIPCLNWRGEPLDLRAAIQKASTWEEKVKKAIEVLRKANRLRRPNFMWPLTTNVQPPRRSRIMRLGLPKSDGRLVFTGARADRFYKLTVLEWDPFSEH